jgi:hypothetical protein
LKCKDIPDEPIIRFLAKRPGEWHNWFFGDDKDVRQAMPPNLPEKLVLGKMRMLMRRGLVTGCGCGCRGDFEITAKGIQWLAQVDSKLSIRPTQNRGDGVSADPKKEE